MIRYCLTCRCIPSIAFYPAAC